MKEMTKESFASDKKIKDRVFFILLFALILAFFMFFGRRGYVLFDDSSSYLALHIVEGVMPGYQLFLFLHRAVFGNDNFMSAVVVSQSVLASLSITVFAFNLYNKLRLKYWMVIVIGMLSIIPFTNDLPQAIVTQEILTEAIAYSIFYMFISALLMAIWNISLKWMTMSFCVALILALTRSQLQILFIICGIIFFYILLKKKRSVITWLAACAGGLFIILLGILFVTKLNTAYRNILSHENSFRGFIVAVQNEGEEALVNKEIPEKKDMEQLQQENAENISIENEEKSVLEDKQQVDFGDNVPATDQIVSLIFARGMYEAEYEDTLLFYDETERNFFEISFGAADEAQCLHTYMQNNGLWRWRDIAGGIGGVGKACLSVQDSFMWEQEQLLAEQGYIKARSNLKMRIGLTLIKAHFGRVLYHTLLLMIPAFVSTIFFQVESLYLLCHIITLILYASAIALMIWAFADKKVDNKYAEFMALILGTNMVFVVVISLIFFGIQRYLVYAFGMFYIAYFLLLLQLWEHYGKAFVEKLINGKRK